MTSMDRLSRLLDHIDRLLGGTPQRAVLVELVGKMDEIKRRNGFDPRADSHDEVALLLAAVHRGYNVERRFESDIEGDHMDGEYGGCTSCEALLDLAHVEATDERLGIGKWAYRPPEEATTDG